MGHWEGFWRWIRSNKGGVLLGVGVLVALPVLLLQQHDDVDGRMARTAFVATLMAFYWITEVLPIPVTALLPLVLFPALGIMPGKEVAGLYLNDSLFLLVGTFMVALGMERWKLHEKLALRFVLLLGHRPRAILGGFMWMTSFLSWWISNTAATSLMTPIALAIVLQMKKHAVEEGSSSPSVDEEVPHLQVLHMPSTSKRSGDMGYEMVELTHRSHAVDEEENGIDAVADDIGDYKLRMQEQRMRELTEKEMLENGASSHLPSVPELPLEDVKINNGQEAQDVEQYDGEEYDMTPNEDGAHIMDSYARGVLFGVAYGASIGGTTTLVGTPTNIALTSQFSALFPQAPAISFFQWMLFMIPLNLVFLTFVWMFLAACFCPAKAVRFISSRIDTKAISQRYLAMGPLNWPQTVIIISFVSMTLLWLTRNGLEELGLPGWNKLLPYGLYFTDATVALIIGIALFVLPARIEEGNLMDWKTAKNLPWDIVLLIGGGFVLADAFVDSGLSKFLGEQMKVLSSLPVIGLLFVLCFSITMITELTSNVATANILLPILASIAVSIGQPPLLLMIPGTLACSYAFMLPVATPPNAIIFSSSLFTVSRMAKAGFLVNLFGVILLTLYTYFFGSTFFDYRFGQVPDWAL